MLHLWYLLGFKCLAQFQIISERPHGNGQFADDLEVNGAPVSRGDESVHPPVCTLRQQIDKWLQKTHPQVLQVFRRLYFSGMGKTHIALHTKG